MNLDRFNPRVWLRDWLLKPTAREHAENHAYGHWINAYHRYLNSGRITPPTVLPKPYAPVVPQRTEAVERHKRQAPISATMDSHSRQLHSRLAALSDKDKLKALQWLNERTGPLGWKAKKALDTPAA